MKEMNQMEPRFSSRLRWQMQPNPLSLLLAEKRRNGEEILDLTISNPTEMRNAPGGIDYPEDEIRAALTKEGIFRYEPESNGLLSAREALAEYYASIGAAIHPEDIILTSSTSEGYGYLFKLLTDPGDDALIPMPGYPLFDFVAGMDMVALHQYALRYSGERWETDFLSLEAQATGRTRAVIAIHPNNPTGNYQQEREQHLLWEFCSSHKCALIVDEVFYEYPSPGAGRPPSFAAAQEQEGLTFTLNGFSKLLGLPQMKLGWITIHGPASLRTATRKQLELIADTYLSVNAPIMHAVPELLPLRNAIAGQIRNRCDANEEYMLRTLPKDRFRVLHREGGWYGVMEVQTETDAQTFCREMLETRNVWMHPGMYYDFRNQDTVALSLVTPPEMFRAGINRLV